MAAGVKRFDRCNETIETLEWELQIDRFPLADDKACASSVCHRIVFGGLHKFHSGNLSDHPRKYVALGFRDKTHFPFSICE